MKEIKNSADFNEVISTDKPILLDFYADWCGPCQTQLPIVEQLAADREDSAVIAKINVDQNRELAQQFQIKSIPALFLIKDGQIKEKLVGFKSKSQLNQLINSYAQIQQN